MLKIILFYPSFFVCNNFLYFWSYYRKQKKSDLLYALKIMSDVILLQISSTWMGNIFAFGYSNKEGSVSR